MTHIRLICLTFLAFFFSELKAQTPESFPSDSVEFFEVMQDYLSDARSEGKDFMKEFEEIWYGGVFSDKEREGIYLVTNKMLKKRMRAFPDFRNYLFTVGTFVIDDDANEESFDAWQSIMLNLLEERNKKKFSDFLEFSNNLFVDNAIYVSAAVQWSADNNNYIFGYDSLPKITFDQLDLICRSRNDSMRINNTRGVYYPLDNKWYGDGGKVTWERAGFSAEEVFAELKEYSLSTKSYTYEADSVIFNNPAYFERPLMGKLTDKVLANMKIDNATYPRFDSYERRLRMENISPGVNYDGGFSMVGNKFLGMGTKLEPALVEFMNKDTLFLLVSSEVFSIRKSTISSDKAAVKIFLNQDSITHPGLNFKFLREEKTLTLYKDNDGISKAPYTNSFHGIEMDFEALVWTQGQPIMQLTNLLGSTKTDALFNSYNFFKQEHFDQIGGMSNVNPLYIIKRMVDNFDTTTLSITELAYTMNLEHTSAQNMVMTYSTLGFMSFNFEKDEFYVNQKLIDYVLASIKKIDYDAISIFSEVEDGVNAKINLLNFDLTINGIRGINLSDSQRVVILPNKGQVTMKRNRGLHFGGIVAAGKFSFYGKEFSFDYEKFKINLLNVDSLSILAETKETDRGGVPIIKPVKTVIQDVNGELLIDNFHNKSGLKDFPEYPIFNSSKESYVYYNSKDILKGAYKKDKFYFQVNPYNIDSLDNFDNKQLNFGGTFVSAGIFPEFEETLRLQEDHSLGFKKMAPADGFPIYGGKGSFHQQIALSNKGLKGNGSLDYITSKSYSNNFIFYPDSMLALAQEQFVEVQKEGVEYPAVAAKSVDIKWLPYKDVMYTSTKKEGMAFYDDQSFFDGTTSLTPNMLKGNGIFHFKDAELSSNQFIFKSSTFDADTADFQLHDTYSDGFALKTQNVKTHVDYELRYAEFEANGKASPIEFPVNQYLCFMEKFKWYMDDGTIELTSTASKSESADVNLEGSKFISTRHDQDSLYFYSPVAQYNTKEHIISAEEVQYINTADAKVYPDSGKLTIRKKAEMDPLKNSKIVANSVTEFHHIYNAVTHITGRKNYSASGYIDYIDENKTEQPIYFANIKVDTTGQTVANGKIINPDFTLSSHFAFVGGVKLYANKEHLVFDGATQISHDCKGLLRKWVDFEAEINPEQIYIPIDSNVVDSGGARLLSSISIKNDSTYMYPGFLTIRRNYSDINVISANGYLHYHKASNEYRISSIEKINENSLAGNYLSLNTSNCKVYGEGLVDLGERTGRLDFVSAGNIVYNTIDDDVVVDLISTLDFFFDDNAMNMIADHINENISLPSINFNRETYQSGLREILGVEKADELIAELSLHNKFKKLPDELNKRFVFNDLKFKWNEDENAYKSFGGIGIANMNKQDVNKYVGGMIRIEKKRSGDIVDFYLEIDANNWYFFNYRRGLMKVVSSNEEFNDRIKVLELDDRKYDNKKGEENFLFMFAPEKMKRDFVRDYMEDL